MDEPLAVVVDSKDPAGQFPFAPPEYLVHLLICINRHRDMQLEHLLHPLGLTVARHRALLVVHRFGPCTMTEVADFSVVERTTMSRTVDQLVKDGLLLREARAGDRRQVLLTVSESGRDLQQKAAQLIWAQNRADLEGISDEEQRIFIRLAQKLAANFAPDALARERVLTFNRPRRG